MLNKDKKDSVPAVFIVPETSIARKFANDVFGLLRGWAWTQFQQKSKCAHLFGIKPNLEHRRWCLDNPITVQAFLFPELPLLWIQVHLPPIALPPQISRET